MDAAQKRISPIQSQYQPTVLRRTHHEAHQTPGDIQHAAAKLGDQLQKRRRKADQKGVFKAHRLEKHPGNQQRQQRKEQLHPDIARQPLSCRLSEQPDGTFTAKETPSDRNLRHFS